MVLYAAEIGGAKGCDLTKPPLPGGFCVSGEGLRAAAGPQTEDEMSIVEAEDRTALPPSIRVRLAGPRDCTALAALLLPLGIDRGKGSNPTPRLWPC